MWKIYKENSEDLGFSISCLFSQAISLKEFKIWLEIVVKNTPSQDIPLYIYDLIVLDYMLYEIDGIVGFTAPNKLSKSEENALIGIAYLRNIDVYDSPISPQNALEVLNRHSYILDKFKYFFPFIDLHNQKASCSKPS